MTDIGHIEKIPEVKFRSSKEGYLFDPNTNYWVLSKDVHISFQNDVLSINRSTVDGFRRTLARYAEELSDKHTANMYHRFQRFVRDTKTDAVTTSAILNWRASLDASHEWYLGALRGFLISWYDFGYEGVSKDVVELLEDMTLKCNIRGLSVSNRCPYTGAMTQSEQLAFYNELNNLFSSDCISLTAFAYVTLLQATARRTAQIRQLKHRDLIKIKEKNSGSENYYLDIPRAKQRSGGFRKEFRRLAITEEVYLIVKNQLRSNQQLFTEKFNIELSNESLLELPLFVDWKLVETYKDQIPTSSIPEFFHASAKMLQTELRSVANLHCAISERTGEIIQLTARRFRRTRGTNLGRKGIGAQIIAEALDHSDTQSARIYTENTADTVQYIDQAIGSQLAPFARAFKGELIKTLSDGERGDDPSARIPNKDNEAVGACGTHEFCIKGYESCYLCEKFRPLVSAPHEKFLNNLYAEKEFRLKKTNSLEYASAKDSLILAVEWVVEACRNLSEGADNEK